ncbi:MAG TPA: hypothetical protein VHU18_04180 [Rhizomicrobium sp.]|jgi:hypothetical protein|nr:hypothetical protein [Rhizomicrobium sp.]
MISFRAFSPLACERWKAFQTVALEALTHAQMHGDARYLIRLGQVLPHELRARFIGWLRSFSPLIGFQRNGEFSIVILKSADQSFKPYAVANAGAEPIFNVQPPAPSPGTRFAREIIEEEFAGKSLKQRLRIVEKWFESRAARSLMRPTLITCPMAATDDLSKYSHHQLMDLYFDATNCLVQSSDRRSGPGAETRQAIFHEWEVRYSRSLVDEYFDWPSTEAPWGGGAMGHVASPADGILNAFGYHVGEVKGRPEAVRHLLLDDIFCCHLPPISSFAYMQEWGSPTTPARLKKIADTLAALCRNEKRRGLRTAPAQREADLEHMYLNYYVRRFGFEWPSR